MKIFISFVRIFYTVTLVLLVPAGFILYMLGEVGAQHGSPETSRLETDIVFISFFVLLLISRLLYYRSPKWLWLGLPTILAMYGFLGFSLLYSYF